MSALGIAALCSWERHLTLISYQLLYVLRKISTGVCFTTAYLSPKKIAKPPHKKQACMAQQVSPKVGLGNNVLCLTTTILSYKSGRQIETTNQL